MSGKFIIADLVGKFVVFRFEINLNPPDVMLGSIRMRNFLPQTAGNVARYTPMNLRTLRALGSDEFVHLTTCTPRPCLLFYLLKPL